MQNANSGKKPTGRLLKAAIWVSFYNCHRRADSCCFPEADIHDSQQLR